MDKHPIDKIFHDGLSQEHWRPSDDNWQEALSLIRAERRKKRKIAFWWIFGAVLITSVLTIYWFSPGYDAQQGEQTASNVVIAEQKNDDPLDTQLLINHEGYKETDISSPLKVEDEKRRSTTLHSPISKSKSSENPLSNRASIKGSLFHDEGNEVKASVKHQEKLQIVEHTVPFARPMLLPLAQLHSGIPYIEDQRQHGATITNSITAIGPVINVSRTTLLSGWTLGLGVDMFPGLFSGQDKFGDFRLRLGYQLAVHDNFAFGIWSGLRYFNGDLPVHAQVKRVEYAIGSRTTSFQLQADQLIMAGVGAGVQYGTGRHRLSLGFTVDYIAGAYGSLREQYFNQDWVALDGRNAKPELVSDQKSWLATEGLNRWQHSTEFAYSYAITSRIELGVAWTHQFSSIVLNDELSRDRMSVSIKKIF